MVNGIEMDALFENSPLFVPGTPYSKVDDYRAAERELRQGTSSGYPVGSCALMLAIGNFVPGDLTEKMGQVKDVEEKASTEKFE